jgi:hypothetical protein
MVALVTGTKSLVRCGDDASAMTTAGDTFTRICHLGFFADAILNDKPIVTDADWPVSANHTLAIATTVNINTVVLELIATTTAGNEKQCNQRQNFPKHEALQAIGTQSKQSPNESKYNESAGKPSISLVNIKPWTGTACWPSMAMISQGENRHS